jgi:hypothetical protein
MLHVEVQGPPWGTPPMFEGRKLHNNSGEVYDFGRVVSIGTHSCAARVLFSWNS